MAIFQEYLNSLPDNCADRIVKNIKVSFDTWIQLLGMLGVLGGLVFVGLEMRQSQTIAIGGQIQARTMQS